MASTLEFEVPYGRRALQMAQVGYPYTAPVPEVAALLYIDQLQRHEPTGLLVRNRFGRLLVVSGYISIEGGPLASMDWSQKARAVGAEQVMEFVIKISSSRRVAQIVRGRRLSVTVMSKAEYGRRKFTACTTDAKGQPIV